MGSKMLGWAWDQELPPARKLVLLALAERATDDDGVCAGGSVRSVAQRCGLSTRSVQRHVRGLGGLVDFGAVPIVSHRGRLSPGPNRYRLLAPWVGRPAIRAEIPWVGAARQAMLARGACLHSAVACASCREAVS